MWNALRCLMFLPWRILFLGDWLMTEIDAALVGVIECCISDTPLLNSMMTWCVFNIYTVKFPWGNSTGTCKLYCCKDMYIPRTYTQPALCCVLLWLDFNAFYKQTFELFTWRRRNLTITPLPMKQTWRIWNSKSNLSTETNKNKYNKINHTKRMHIFHGTYFTCLTHASTTMTFRSSSISTRMRRRPNRTTSSCSGYKTGRVSIPWSAAFWRRSAFKRESSVWFILKQIPYSGFLHGKKWHK